MANENGEGSWLVHVHKVASQMMNLSLGIAKSESFYGFRLSNAHYLKSRDEVIIVNVCFVRIIIEITILFLLYI